MASFLATRALTVSPVALKSNFAGETQQLKATSVSVCSVKRIAPRAALNDSEDVAACTRRDAIWLSAMAAVGVSLTRSEPALAAYGEPANVFGTTPKQSGYLPIKKDGFSIEVPSKWNPSKEKDFDNVALRWEDNFDQASSLVVTKKPADGKKSITDYGSAVDFLENNSFLLGEQVWNSPNTRSEGGFEAGRAATASILDNQVTKDDAGNEYYKYEVLTRTADGNEGGRHHLITAFVNSGNLYVLKVTIGDKRWFKGSERIARGIAKSFSVA